MPIGLNVKCDVLHGHWQRILEPYHNPALASKTQLPGACYLQLWGGSTHTYLLRKHLQEKEVAVFDGYTETSAQN